MRESKVKIIGRALPNIPFEDRPEGSDVPVWRYSGNPVIRRNQVKGAERIFNSAVVPYKDGFAAVLRSESNAWQPHLRMGWSKDGIRFEVEDSPLDIRWLDTGKKSESITMYDPRVIRIEDTYYVIWCDGVIKYCTLGLAATTDFKTFYRYPDPMFASRNGVLFPRKVGGEYLLFSRPSDLGHTKYGDIFLSKSSDLKRWGDHKLVIESGTAPWCHTKVGAGPEPIETTEGWLVFYHGVTTTCNGFVYSMGGALLDLDDPSVVRYNCKLPLLLPETQYELTGAVQNVVFPCGVLTDAATGRIALYYGAADTETALAFTTAEIAVDFIKSNAV